MTYHLKSLAVRAAAVFIALVVCAAAALLLNRFMTYLDSGITASVLYVLPSSEEPQKPANLSRVSF
jgi:hypothetical protein